MSRIKPFSEIQDLKKKKKNLNYSFCRSSWGTENIDKSENMRPRTRDPAQGEKRVPKVLRTTAQERRSPRRKQRHRWDYPMCWTTLKGVKFYQNIRMNYWYVHKNASKQKIETFSSCRKNTTYRNWTFKLIIAVILRWIRIQAKFVIELFRKDGEREVECACVCWGMCTRACILGTGEGGVGKLNSHVPQYKWKDDPEINNCSTRYL